VETLEPDSAVLLETNPRVVLAFLAGVNTELTRELRWRGFPVDARATAVRTFWDRRGQGGPGPGTDAAPIDGWAAGSSLEDAARAAGAGPLLTLVVRSRLLASHPRTAIYAVRATVRPDGRRDLAAETEPANVRYPSFTGGLLGDVRFFGFTLSAAEARSGSAGPGWFFVLQQQLTETRFGANPAGPPPLGTGTTAADVALHVLRRPVRVAVHADDLLPAP
jgi:hypothetical protein